MIGYVKIDPSELKGKHLNLYRAVYCGLCHSSSRASRFLAPFHSYDFAFLAALRLAFHPDQVKTEKRRCLPHPLKKKTSVQPCPVLETVARSELVLTAEKLRDDLLDRDVSFFRRLASRFFLRRFDRAVKKISAREPAFAAFSASVREKLSQGRELEKENADLDALCASFAAVLSEVFSFGAEGEEARILSRIGEMIGRFLYTADALDDREKDRKKGAFNPLLRDPGPKDTLRRVMLFYCDEAYLALQLARSDPDLTAVCENVIGFGLKKEIDRLFENKDQE